MIELNKYEKRLYQEWKQHGKIIIGVDFDDTLYPWKFKSPEDATQFERTIQLLRIAHETGAYIVIFTACNNDRFIEIQDYCEKIKLPIDTINKTPFEIGNGWGKNGKIYANIFIDDRAGLNEAVNMLEKVMYIIRGENSNFLTLGESVRNP